MNNVLSNEAVNGLPTITSPNGILPNSSQSTSKTNSSPHGSISLSSSGEVSASLNTNALVQRSNEITPPVGSSGDGPLAGSGASGPGSSGTTGGGSSGGRGGAGSTSGGGGNGGNGTDSHHHHHQPIQHAVQFEPPARPGRGSEGRSIALRANHFEIRMPKGFLHHYDVMISPEKCPRRVNREIIETMVNSMHYQKYFYNQKPVFDGRRNMYTREPLPISKENVSNNFFELIFIKNCCFNRLSFIWSG